MGLSESELVDAVLRIRLADAAKDTAAKVFEVLVAEGHGDLTMSQVKKASSKAMKQNAPQPSVPATAPAPKATDDKSAAPPRSKKEEKAAKAAAGAMKAAEAHMMDMCRNLRIAEGEEESDAVVATADRGERFIQTVVARALEAKLLLNPATKASIKERVDADLSVLEWAIMAEKAGTLTLPTEARGSALLQIERLKNVRGAKTLSQVEECYHIVDLAKDDSAEIEAAAGPGQPGVEYARRPGGQESTAASIDRVLAKSGALAKSVFDDDEVD